MIQSEKIKTRLAGLDSIRFFMALIVVLVHNDLVFPLFFGVERKDKIGYFLQGIYKLFFNAPAAVIVFFLISGFCIHFQYRNGEVLRMGSFYRRRFIRILIPLFCSCLIFYYCGIPIEFSTDAIFWSIVCEEVYYFIYPLMLWASKTVGWIPLLAIAYVFSYVVAFTDLNAKAYPSFGLYLNWVLGYPCWLLGVIIADKADKDFFLLDGLKIWCWRLGLIILFGFFQALRFHTVFGYPLTLNLLAIYVFFWLRREIYYFKTNPPPKVFEWLGKWSYSVYLVHMPALSIVSYFAFCNLGVFFNWFFVLFFVFFICYLFYVLVEYPSLKISKIGLSFLMGTK